MTAAPSPTPSPQILRREDDGGVVTLTLTQPQNRNALGLRMIDTLIVALADLARDEGARVIVLAGDGPALSAGHNLKEMQAHRNDADRGRSFYELLFARCSVLMQAIVALPKPVIAAVEGIATAAGCQLVAACDLAVASDSVAVRAVRHQRRPLLLDAARRGRTRRVAQACAGDGDDRQALQRRGRGALRPRQPGRRHRAGRSRRRRRSARTIAEHSASSLAIGKRAFYEQIEQPLDVAYALAAKAMVDNLAEPDCVEGMAAFLEKRRPNYGASGGPG